MRLNSAKMKSSEIKSLGLVYWNGPSLAFISRVGTNDDYLPEKAPTGKFEFKVINSKFANEMIWNNHIIYDGMF